MAPPAPVPQPIADCSQHGIFPTGVVDHGVLPDAPLAPGYPQMICNSPPPFEAANWAIDFFFFFAGAAAVLGAQDKPAQNPPDKKPEGVLIAPQAQRDVIRRSVDLVTNTVIVRDPQGQFVADLGKKDFEVYEDGVKQDVSYFTHANLPIALSVLIDTSASMESRLQTAQDAAIGFAKKLREQDLAEIVDFHRWTAWSPWEDLDPDLQRSYSGPDAGTGSVYESYKKKE